MNFDFFKKPFDEYLNVKEITEPHEETYTFPSFSLNFLKRDPKIDNTMLRFDETKNIAYLLVDKIKKPYFFSSQSFSQEILVVDMGVNGEDFILKETISIFDLFQKCHDFMYDYQSRLKLQKIVAIHPVKIHQSSLIDLIVILE